ncbi:MAG TPA: heterodisulfide reductase-related iron-sulfur binding cluster [Acidimicrobiia bacterium]|nr:heterodisulfide reductase-related iron-sulfur binding cluster [Acidimicrobiia bacterium]
MDLALTKTCIHCGFCLPTCPTYVVWGEEMDSPRGRIVLMRTAGDDGGDIGAVATHIDRCLGCMACVTACPSGVQYDVLIEQMRPEVERRHRRTPSDRAFRRFCFEVFTHPGRLRAMVPFLVAGRRLGLDRRLRAWLDARAGISQPPGPPPSAGSPGAPPGPGHGAPISMAGATSAGATESPGLTQPPPSLHRNRRSFTGILRKRNAGSTGAGAGTNRRSFPGILRKRNAGSSGGGQAVRRVAAMMRVTPDVTLSAVWRRLPERTPARGASRGTVGLLQGCVARVFFARTNEATVRVLAAEGFDVVVPPAAGCCGALFMHSGAEDEARERARATIEAFEGCGTVAVNAAGCGSAMKEYGRLLADDPDWAERARAFSARVADVTEVLAGVEPRAPRHPVPLTVAYHDACHLAHAQAVRNEPRSVLAGIPGLTVTQPAEWEICCGSAGLYNLLEPEPAAELGRRKVANLRATGADAVVAGNPGCALQISAHSGRALPVYHPVELLDASISGRSLP